MKFSCRETTIISRKTIITLSAIILIMGSILFPAEKADADRKNKTSGIYAVINGRPAHTSKDYVQVEIFSSFYCSHCYNFFLQEESLKKRNNIKFIHIPIQWGNGSTKATEAYLIARDMGKGDEMRTRLFDAKFRERKDISDIAFLNNVAASLGLGKRFGQMLESGTKVKEVADNLEMAHQLSINATPTVIVGGNMIVMPRMTGGNINVFVMNIDTIVDSLSKMSSSKKGTLGL